MKKYNLIVAGGTFDHFHKGHEDFLLQQLDLSERILLGITSDKYVTAYKNFADQFYEERKKAVSHFLKDNNALSRVKIVPIDTPGVSGEGLTAPIEAIVVTPLTKKGGELINSERKEKKLPSLPIEVVPLTPAGDGQPISSSRIRNGEILRDGTLCLSEKTLSRSYTLPENLRADLRKPFGTLIKDNNFDFASLPEDQIVTVGDIAAKTFVERKRIPKIAIVDFVVERERQFEKPTDLGFSGKERILTVTNPAGEITNALLQGVKKAFAAADTHILITVIGEEDLAVIPVLLASPLGYHVFYGQPGVGLVQVIVTEEKKKFAYQILQQFHAV